MPFLWNCWSHGSLGSLRSLKQLSPGFTEAQQESEEKGVSWGLLCPQAHRAQESCAGKGAVKTRPAGLPPQVRLLLFRRPLGWASMGS